METLKQKYAWISFVLGTVLGILSIILFMWYPLGISFPIFAIVAGVFGVFPPIFLEGKNGVKRMNWTVFLFPIFIVISSLFVYRLSMDLKAFTFLTLPILYMVALVSVYNKEVVKNLGLLSFVVLPITLFISWFVDLFKFVPNLKSEKSVSTKFKSVFWRAVLGLIISIPFVMVILALLTSADSVFSKYLSDFLSNTFELWFKDLPTMVLTLGKFVAGFFVSICFSVFFFSVYTKDSFVNSLVEKTTWMSIKNWKRDWDVVVSSVFMFLLNLVFITFVVVQFVYLFGGSANVIGLKANFTYADYARRGFFELMVVASFVYIIAYILNFKVATVGFWQKLIYRANHVLMVLAVLVISYSANARLLLYESVYGFTGMRLFVHLVIGAIAIMYLAMYISLLFKKGEQFLNSLGASLILIIFAIVLVVPFDYVSAKLNYNRYLSTKKIDIGYFNSLSDEVVPVLIDMAKDTKVEEKVKNMVLANLQSRYETRIKENKLGWQSYNFMFEKIKKETPSVIGDTNWEAKLESSLDGFLKGYVELIAQENFDKAYSEYWSSATTKQDIKGNTINVLTYSPSTSPYDMTGWNIGGRNIYATLNISFMMDCPSVFFDPVRDEYEQLTIINENGDWKIKNAESLKLGDMEGLNDSYKKFVNLCNTASYYSD